MRSEGGSLCSPGGDAVPYGDILGLGSSISAMRTPCYPFLEETVILGVIYEE